MIDITALSSLVSAFRAETQKDSITPEKLGDILQKILDLLNTAAKDGDVSTLATWKQAVTAVGEVLTALSAGTVDADSVHLSFKTANTNSGAVKSYADTIGIQAATTDKAGVMTAQQVKDLNENKKKISDYEQWATYFYQILQTLSQTMDDQLKKEQTERKSADDSLEQKITSLDSSYNTLSQTVSDNSSNLKYYWQLLTNEQNSRNNSDKALQQNISSLSQQVSDNDVSYNNRLSSLERDTDDLYQSVSSIEAGLEAQSGNSDMYHIECHVKGDYLYVLGAQQLVAKGLVPVIFRYTVKQNRESKETAEKIQHDKRQYKKKMRGWHLFYDTKKVRFQSNMLEIRRDLKDQDITYFSSPRYLLGNFKFVTDDEGKLEDVRVGYGKRMYSVMTGHVFKFALAFADMKIKSYTFDFRNLKTNLAIFKIYAYHSSDNEDFEQSITVKFSV